MNIAIIDAEIVGKSKHRFPNLACMKISAYHKAKGDHVTLKTTYNYLMNFDRIYISKVFTKTEVPPEVLTCKNVKYGGTGFFYDQAELLPDEIEHTKPDYSLYDRWIEEKINAGEDIKDFRFYKNYSIGFTTRGCFRKCYFCVNKNYNQSIKHSPVSEFLDSSKPYVLLLDDNVFACKDWRIIFKELQDTNKPFQFKQGLDERLLTEDKCRILFNESKYHEDYIFAFDHFEDKDLIVKKLKLIKSVLENKKESIKFYVFCGSKNPAKEYEAFYEQDIIELFERIKILSSFGCFPYVMRHEDYKNSPYAGIYTAAASWCNQPSIFKRMSFRDFCIQHSMKFDVYKNYKTNYDQYLKDGYPKGSYWRYLEEFESVWPEIAREYFDMKFQELNKY